ncbi:hypothetical protein IscW_ISCW002931 [Ixodes scapularis]|uniref:Uncharacterized protein n=1 Tax=Ixodes scapularis TaxID=6945 RepID=B7PDL4_IXOSC|nr:hypothetical protein IscW_ISCW002931 [Ixodes scapularis]|eukprot:XP_002410893.1 hypothetical protein IscW_ISCW002931 [Ixodes scapularis]
MQLSLFELPTAQRQVHKSNDNYSRLGNHHDTRLGVNCFYTMFNAYIYSRSDDNYYDNVSTIFNAYIYTRSDGD